MKRRSTFLVRLTYDRARSVDGTAALDLERRYHLVSETEGRRLAVGEFVSPIGDEAWMDLVDAIRACSRGDGDERRHQPIKQAGRSLRDTLVGAIPELGAFLESNVPRRLVIESDRAELHQLPWEALFWRLSPGTRDLSLVRASLGGFSFDRVVSKDKVRVLPIFGPDTGKNTAGTIAQLKTPTRYERCEVVLPKAEADTIVSWVRQTPAEIVHIEAHGRRGSGIIELASDEQLSPTQLARHVGARAIVLLWSCYCSRVNSAGGSHAQALHQAGSDMVLAFPTPLRNKTASRVSMRFFEGMFDALSGGDPESVVVEERQRQLQMNPTESVWAAMSLWMRRPVDMTPAINDGPRVPRKTWDSATSVGEDAFRQAMPGEITRVASSGAEDRIAHELAENYRGAAVWLHGTLATEAGAASLREQLRQARQEIQTDKLEQIEEDHAGDAILSILEIVDEYSPSLLVWQGAYEREELVLELIGLPLNVSVLLIHDPAGHGPGASATGADVAELERLVDQGRFDEAAKMVTEIEKSGVLDDRERWRVARAQYVIATKRDAGPAQLQNLHQELDGVISGYCEVESLRFESLLVQGNMLQRCSEYARVKPCYDEALHLALRLENKRDEGRARLELGFLAFERGQFAAAEAMLRSALEALEVSPQPRDRDWSSALGRACRDYADLLLSMPDPVPQHPDAERLLRRAIAIHACDGRIDQLGASLRTRARLARKKGDWRRADQDYHLAASLLLRVGNRNGWLITVLEMASAAIERSDLELARAILTSPGCLPDEGVTKSRRHAAIWSELALVHWRMGELESVRRCVEEARRLLPEGMRHELRRLNQLRVTLKSMLGNTVWKESS